MRQHAKLIASKNEEIEASQRFIKLTNKETGFQKKFKRYPDNELQFLKAKFNKEAKKVSDFDMNKLELEYDYETDEDQMYKAKELLIRETVQAVQFFVTDDPELLVGNLAGCN